MNKHYAIELDDSTYRLSGKYLETENNFVEYYGN